MSTLPNFLRSLLLTSIFSFLAPILLIGAILVGLTALSYVPYLEAIAPAGVEQVSRFLAVFGSGSSPRGVLLIGTVCSLVGMLFDTYAFYRYQNLRDN